MLKNLLAAYLVYIATSAASFAAEPVQIGKDTIIIGHTSWSSSASITALGKKMLEKIGYKVELKQLDTGLIYQALATGQIETFFSGWLPGQKTYFDKLSDKLDIIGTASGPAPGGLVVPSYVSVNSIEELSNPDVAAQFDGKIIGIDAGAGLMINTKKAVESYKLGMELVPSSGAAMTAAFKSAYESKKPIVVTGWCPTAMCAKYDLKFLKDPQGVYGDQRNWTVVNKTFRDDHPRATVFLGRFTLFEKHMSEILLWIEDESMSADAAADRFIEENKDLVSYMIGGLDAGAPSPGTSN